MELYCLSSLIFVIFHVILRFLEPQDVNTTGMLLLAVLGIVFNGVAFWCNRRAKTLNTKMVNWHLLEDLLGEMVVPLESISMHFGEYP